jgi:DNA-directed RNA polymerase specialized sigma subunit
MKFIGVKKDYHKPVKKKGCLTEEQKEEIAALLEYYEPVSLKEIAKEYEISVRTVLYVKKNYCKDSPRFNNANWSPYGVV